MKIVGLDVGSTTVKAVVIENNAAVWREYQRHNTRQAEMVLDFLVRMDAECGLTTGRDRIFLTGSGAGLIAPLVGGKLVQEVVAVAAAVERLHSNVRFVSEIGGEDMKTIFFTVAESGKNKQVYMQSACSGGTGTFIEKTARKLRIPLEALGMMSYNGRNLHKISSKCGIFAETDANTLVKSGVPIEDIIASLFEAVVYQNLATLTKGNTPLPQVLLLGGPNLFFRGLQEAWRHHLRSLWQQRQVALPEVDPDSLIHVPTDALYYGCLGCIDLARDDAADTGLYSGTERLRWWIEEGQHEQKTREGGRGLIANEVESADFLTRYGCPKRAVPAANSGPGGVARATGRPVLLGCDLGSTTAKAAVLSPEAELLFSCYTLSKGNPIEDAKSLFHQVHESGFVNIGGLAITGYGKDLLKDILGADVAIVETIAHARGALHFFPDVDVICDVGGCDVKIVILRQGTVSDFRLNSQCSSGNGAFLQGVAERYGIPLEDYADRAFHARAMPKLAMGCAVFLQSDIINQQRKGWSADEMMAALAAVLPLNVWIYAGQLQNLRAVGRKFVLQGGTHRNLAVVKAQVDFLREKAPGADVAVHPFPGEAGAIGAALCALDWRRKGRPSGFRGFDTIEALRYKTTLNKHTTCQWCTVNCKRTFIDVQLPGAAGRPWSKVPLARGWGRVISGNSCPKGMVEDVVEMREVKARLEEIKRVHQNIAEMVRREAFRRPTAAV